MYWVLTMNAFVLLLACSNVAAGKNCDVCRLPKSVGPGRAAFSRWYYDISEEKCSKFIFGGVGGNGNNFRSKADCEERCSGCSENADRRGTDVCSLPRRTGMGRASFTRWYYNSNEGKCMKFYYGGVGGNENNFRTKEECEEKCT